VVTSGEVAIPPLSSTEACRRLRKIVGSCRPPVSRLCHAEREGAGTWARSMVAPDLQVARAVRKHPRAWPTPRGGADLADPATAAIRGRERRWRLSELADMYSSSAPPRAIGGLAAAGGRGRLTGPKYRTTRDKGLVC
jgi:hypothetical protein